MPTERKVATVTELQQRLGQAQALIFTGFHGLNANEMVELRAELAKQGLEYRVIKNRLALRAAQGAGLEIAPLLQGETGICFDDDDPVLAFKLTSKLAKKFANYKVRGGISEGQLLDEQGALELANLPSREVLLTQLVATLQGPMRRLTVVLSALLRQLVVVLSEIERTKAEAAEPAEQAPAETQERAVEAAAEPEIKPEPETETEKGAETAS
ncbi:MAG TPA: 50S ribosomal protein L10 [Candidatus Fraserbacteria bacterium]|nr:50S ribosomal protein L10 [Candidatus Fraserbacteria bacterium]